MAHEHLDVTVLGTDGPGHVGGAVRTVVVDHQHPDVRHCLAQHHHELGQVLGLVQRRHDGHDPHDDRGYGVLRHQTVTPRAAIIVRWVAVERVGAVAAVRVSGPASPAPAW